MQMPILADDYTGINTTILMPILVFLTFLFGLLPLPLGVTFLLIYFVGLAPRLTYIGSFLNASPSFLSRN